MSRFFNFTPDDEKGVERQQLLAQALIQQGQQGAPQDWDRMRVTPKYGIGHGLTQLASALGGAYLDKKATDRKTELDEQKRQKFADALAASTFASDPANPQNAKLRDMLAQLPVEQQQALLTKLADKQLFPNAPERVDLGGKIGLLDERGNMVGSIDKSNSPDSLLGAEVAVRGQDIGAETSKYSTDVGARTAMRGQDIGASSARYSADTSAAASKYGTDMKLYGDAVKDEREQSEAASKAKQRAEQVISSADNVISTIDKAIATTNMMTTGRIGAITRSNDVLSAGSDAKELSNYITTIKANIGFDRLQLMRELSPTGGALGQVAVQELEALQSSVANLDPNASGKVLKQQLGVVRNHYDNIKKMIAKNNGISMPSAEQASNDGGAADEEKSVDVSSYYVP